MLIWFLLCLLCGSIARYKGRSAFGYFLLSLFLTPIVGLIAVLIPKKEKGVTAKARRKGMHDIKTMSVMRRRIFYAIFIFIFFPLMGFFTVKIFELDASEPITTNFIITKAEIYTPAETWTTVKRGKKRVQPHPYLEVFCKDEVGKRLTLVFGYKPMANTDANLGNGVTVENINWNTSTPSGLTNMQSTLLKTSSMTITYRNGWINPYIDEVTCNF